MKNYMRLYTAMNTTYSFLHSSYDFPLVFLKLNLDTFSTSEKRNVLVPLKAAHLQL